MTEKSEAELVHEEVDKNPERNESIPEEEVYLRALYGEADEDGIYRGDLKWLV